MKHIISIITWINRCLMFILSISLIIGIIDRNTLAISGLIGLLLGFFQVLFFGITLFSRDVLNIKLQKFQIIYPIAVTGYFSFWYLASLFQLFSDEMLFVVLFTLPLILAVLFTIFLEKTNKL